MWGSPCRRVHLWLVAEKQECHCRKMPQEALYAKRKTPCGAKDSPACGGGHPTVKPAACAQQDTKKARIDRSWVPVLADEYLRDVETVAVYVAEITDRKQTSRLIKILSSALPLDSLQHLKRVRSSKMGMEVILRPYDDCFSPGDTVPLAAVLGNQLASLEGISPFARVVQVPKHAPLVRRQFERSNCLWPTQFHESKYIAKVLGDQLFGDVEKLEMERYMALSVEAARFARTDSCATVVNPSTKKVLVTAPRSGDRPLRHAVLVALDLVARLQGGGSWEVPRGCLLYDVSEEDLEVDGKAPYVCTGYDVYSTTEPCITCAMALVHSRIRRVFYGRATTDGALGSRHKLHVQEGLNHHFEVWRGVLEKECASVGDGNS